MTEPALPEPVRVRVVALAAAVLPALAEVPAGLPAPLRKVAAFAPARRARAGAPALTRALTTDADLRRRVAAQLALEAPAAAPGRGPGDAHDPVDPDDPVDLAAREWLGRVEGWEERYAAALEALRARAAGAAEADALLRRDEEVARLRERLARAEEAARAGDARREARLADAKAENAVLRRRLGEARAELRAATGEADEGRGAAERAAAEATARAGAAEAEVRRLRRQVDELTAQVAAVRGDARAERDEVTVRARLLLDLLLDAGQGLRRELALPTGEALPGDRVADAVDAARDPAGGDRRRSGRGAPLPLSPTGVEQLLALPRARLVVDGYNVSKAAWPSSALDAQRLRLLGAVGPLVARTGAETTVVFDAAAVAQRPAVPGGAPRGVRVLFSPEGVIADDVVRDLVAAEPQGRPVVVVTSDGELARDVRAAGARVASAETFLAALRV